MRGEQGNRTESDLKVTDAWELILKHSLYLSTLENLQTWPFENSFVSMYNLCLKPVRFASAADQTEIRRLPIQITIRFQE